MTVVRLQLVSTCDCNSAVLLHRPFLNIYAQISYWKTCGCLKPDTLRFWRLEGPGACCAHKIKVHFENASFRANSLSV